MSYINICNTIKDKVNENTDLSAVYNYNVKTYDSYPTAIISPSDGVEGVFDCSTNNGIYNVSVRVVDRNIDEETMEPRMRKLCDDLLIGLRSIPLGGTIDKLELGTTWGWTDDEEPLRVFEIKCICSKLYMI